MGKKLVLSGTTLTDASAPQLARVDQLEAAGSLYLLDLTHPLATFAAGVPADGTAVPNLATPFLGIDNGALNIQGAINDGVRGKIERSGKGGLHVIVAQGASLGTGQGVRLVLPTSLYAYWAAHPTHAYYASIWDRVTRGAPDVGGLESCDYAASDDTSNGIACGYNGAWSAIPGGSLGQRPLPATVGPRFSSFGTAGSGVTSTVQAPNSGWPCWGTPVSTLNAATVSTRDGRWNSFIFYRCYIEDLTVSGRTYAEVDALDYALYTEEVLTSGGRYSGDTFTDPATVP